MEQPQEAHQSHLERIREERKEVSKELRSRMSAAITGAFGLVAGIAWNDAVKATIDYFYPPTQGHDILPKFIYAIVITLIVTLAIYLISKVFAEKDGKK